MLIGVDIDNVVAEFEAAFRAWINRHAGLTLRRCDITRYSVSECCPLSADEVAELFWRFVRSGGLRRLRLIPHARSSLAALARHGEVRLVTSRPALEEVVADTRRWLELKGLKGHGLVFAERKWEAAAGFSVFVEDSLEQAGGLARAGVRVLLLDYPWNRGGALPANVRRVRSWPEVVREMGDAP